MDAHLNPPRAVQLLDVATGARVPAVLRAIANSADLDRIEIAWGRAREEASEAIRTAGGEVEHGHWDWTLKGEVFESSDYGGVLLESGGEPQGVLLFNQRLSTTRLPPDIGLPLLHVEFVEAAPWNAKVFGATQRFRPVGAVLIREAVRISEARGCAGRVGLVSLSQAEEFYTKIGMARLVADGELQHEGLAYFEFTVAGAIHFLAQNRRGK